MDEAYRLARSGRPPPGRVATRGLPLRPVASRHVRNAFYEPAGTDAFVASPVTAGPWSAQAQHGGPPSALAARAIQRHDPDEGQRLARGAVDILRPVPGAKGTGKARTVPTAGGSPRGDHGGRWAGSPARTGLA